MRSQAARFGGAALTRAADIVNTGLTEMTGATAPRLQLELICARILLPAASGEQGYGARLDRLERRIELGGGPAAGSSGSGGRPACPRPRRRPRAGPPPPAAAPTGRAGRAGPTRRRPRAVAVPGGSRTGSRTGAGTSSPTGDPTGASPTPSRPTAAAGPRETSVQVEAAPAPVPAASTSPGPSGAAEPSSGGRSRGSRRRGDPPGVARRAGPDLSDEPGDLDLRVAERAGAGLRRPASRARHHDPGAGQHVPLRPAPEVVRQALIDEIGLDVKVEGVPSTGCRPFRRPPTTAPHPGGPGPGGPGPGGPGPGTPVRRAERSGSRRGSTGPRHPPAERSAPPEAPGRPAGRAGVLGARAGLGCGLVRAGPDWAAGTTTAPPEFAGSDTGRSGRAAPAPQPPSRAPRPPPRRPTPRRPRRPHRPPTTPPARRTCARSWPGPVSRPSSARARGPAGRQRARGARAPAGRRGGQPRRRGLRPLGRRRGGRRARPRRQGARRVRGPLRFEDPQAHGARRARTCWEPQRCRGNIPRVRLP